VQAHASWALAWPDFEDPHFACRRDTSTCKIITELKHSGIISERRSSRFVSCRTRHHSVTHATLAAPSSAKQSAYITRSHWTVLMITLMTRETDVHSHTSSLTLLKDKIDIFLSELNKKHQHGNQTAIACPFLRRLWDVCSPEAASSGRAMESGSRGAGVGSILH